MADQMRLARFASRTFSFYLPENSKFCNLLWYSIFNPSSFSVLVLFVLSMV